MSTRRDVRSERRGGEARDPKKKRRERARARRRCARDGRREGEDRGAGHARGARRSAVRSTSASRKISYQVFIPRSGANKSSTKSSPALDDEMGTLKPIESASAVLALGAARRSKRAADSLWDRNDVEGGTKRECRARTRNHRTPRRDPLHLGPRRALARAPSAANAHTLPTGDAPAGFRAEYTVIKKDRVVGPALRPPPALDRAQTPPGRTSVGASRRPLRARRGVMRGEHRLRRGKDPARGFENRVVVAHLAGMLPDVVPAAEVPEPAVRRPRPSTSPRRDTRRGPGPRRCGGTRSRSSGGDARTCASLIGPRARRR